MMDAYLLQLFHDEIDTILSNDLSHLAPQNKEQ